jgi:hypothetical protein
MCRVFLIIVLLLQVLPSLAQQPECKVLISEIAGKYSGECKSGLAHGKGIAQGTDHYEGQFIKGLPEGEGVYTWSDGIYYEGNWEKGLRHGEGRMVYPDSVVSGIWKKDKYAGKKIIAPYSIVSSMSVLRSTFAKTNDRNNAVNIRIKIGGMDNISIEGFSMVYDSGSEYRSGNYYGLDNVRYPLSVKIKYRSWNQLMSSQFNVVFEFVINEPGTWDVVIQN